MEFKGGFFKLIGNIRNYRDKSLIPARVDRCVKCDKPFTTYHRNIPKWHIINIEHLPPLWFCSMACRDNTVKKMQEDQITQEGLKKLRKKIGKKLIKLVF